MKNIDDMYRLSPMQAGMLFHCLLAEHEGLYFEQYATELEGELDAAVLRGAWLTVIARHGALRTAFAWRALREPLQVVFHQVTLPWTTVDWTNRSGMPAGWLERLRRADRARPFVLTRAPLVRFTLVRLAADRHVLLWSVHHLVVDGWSLALVRQEVAEHYRLAQSARAAAYVPPPPFVEYIRWLERQDGVAAESFWRQYLEGSTPTLLPVRPDAVRATDSGEESPLECVLPIERTASIQAAARRHELTLHTVCLGAWALVLGRYAGADDVLFGETVSGRPPGLPQVERMIGAFINTVPVRVSLARGELAIEWLARLQARVAAAREYAYAPLVDVRQWSGAPASAPLFETLVVYENYPGAASDAPDRPPGSLRARPLATVARTNYPLTLVVRPGAQLQIVIEADVRRVGVEDARRLLDELVATIESLMANEGTVLSHVSPMTAAERAEAVGESTAAAPSSTDHIAPRDAIELELVRLWEKLLGTHPIGVRDTFAGRGGHSILILRLAAQIERTFDVRIPLADLVQGMTIERLAFAIRQRGARPESRLTALQPNGDGLPLFAIVPAGGTLACYLALASLMGQARPFYALQPRASLAESASAMTIESMARGDLLELRRIQPNGPYRIVGWSMGGLVAYEMAGQLLAAGEEVGLLALIDTVVPRADEPARDAADAAAELVARQFSLETADLDAEHLTGEARLELLIERARSGGHVAHEVERRWLRWLVDGFRIGVEAVQRYRPRPYAGRVLLICAADGAAAASDPTRGWEALARGGVDVHSVPGTHQSIVRPPHVHRLAECLRARLEEAPAPAVEANDAA